MVLMDGIPYKLSTVRGAQANDATARGAKNNAHSSLLENQGPNARISYFKGGNYKFFAATYILFLKREKLYLIILSTISKHIREYSNILLLSLFKLFYVIFILCC